MGTPRIPCEEGLFCMLPQHVCVEATGMLNTRCGDGMPPCDQGLRCNGAPFGDVYIGYCEPLAEKCAPGSCPSGLFCWPLQNKCRTADGTIDSFCGGEMPACEEGLYCASDNYVCRRESE